MRSLPDRDSDLDANNRWVIDKLMDLTEEVVCEPLHSGPDAPGTEESMRSVQMAVERGEGKAEEEAIGRASGPTCGTGCGSSPNASF